MEYLHVDQFQKSTDELLKDFLASMTPEERLAGLRPEELIAALRPEQIIQHSDEILRGMTPEQQDEFLSRLQQNRR